MQTIRPATGPTASLLHRRLVSLVLLALIVFPTLFVSPAQARWRFEEGDWIAWGDARQFGDFSVGRNTIYVGTSAGILRWDRNEHRWQLPWFSVPGPLDEAYLLRNVTFVREDPLTMDVYARYTKGWVRRNIANDRWEAIDAPAPEVLQRLHQNDAPRVSPDRNLITPFQYFLNQDNELQYKTLSWPYDGGVTDDWGQNIYGWKGFGLGTYNQYNSNLKLYPTGPGPTLAMDVNADVIWCASTLNRDGGWAWERIRSEDHWNFFAPDIVWGLEPGEVNELRIGPDSTVWMATNQGVMYRMNGMWHQVRKEKGLPRSDVYDIQPWGNGAWVATLFGLAYVDGPQVKAIRPDPKTEPLAASSIFTQIAGTRDSLFAAGPGLLASFTDGPGWREIPGPPTVGSATRPTALLATDSLLAIGDRVGFAWRDTSGTWHEAMSALWNQGTVLSIAYQGGFFWLGTDEGLIRYNPKTAEVIRYTPRDGLPGNTVFAVYGEGDWLWLGTDVALVRFHWNVEGRFY